MPNEEPRGSEALRGIPERLTAFFFEPVDYDRRICGKATLVVVYRPSCPDPIVWKHVDPSKDLDKVVPAGCEVKVIDGRICFTGVGPS